MVDIIDDGQNQQQKSIRVMLSLPRCGTHFMWTRYVHSDRYQLIFDADIIPALSVLSDECDETLDFLYPPPKNPYYNFGYNSLIDTKRRLTASQHLDMLSDKYSASSGFDLFKKVLDSQDNGGRILLSVNRFVYTTNYEFLFKDFKWKIEHAERSFRLLYKWISLCGYQFSFAMVIREISSWIKSQLKMYGKESKIRIVRRLRETPAILETCRDLHVPVFMMEDMIRSINSGDLEFENVLTPLQQDEIDVMWKNLEKYENLIDKVSSDSPKSLRAWRLVQYLLEKDPIKRISIVRSIGSFPTKILRYIPVLRRSIQDDYEGIILNNAKIKK